MGDLLPCPFCGANARLCRPTCNKLTPYRAGDCAFPRVRCTKCWAEAVGKDWDDSCESAIAAWNRRAPSAQHERIVAGLEAERDSLRAFAQDVMEGWPYGAPDGGDLQELAEKLGLLKPVEMAKPCAEECCCAEFYGEDDGPFRCYRKTSLLTGNPESNRNIDAFLAQTAEGVT